MEKLADWVDADDIDDAEAANKRMRVIVNHLNKLGDGSLFKALTPGELKHAGFDDQIEYAGATKELPGGVRAVGVFDSEGVVASASVNGNTSVSAHNVVLDASTTGRILRSLRIVFVSASVKTKELDSGKEHVRLSAGEVVSICGKIVEFCEEALRHKNSYERYEKQTDKFLARMDKISNDTRNHDNDKVDAMRLRTAIASGLASVLRNSLLWQQSVERRGVSISRAALDYCNASLNTSNTN